MITINLTDKQIEIILEKINPYEFSDPHAWIEWAHNRLLQLDGFFDLNDLKMLIKAMEAIKETT